MFISTLGVIVILTLSLYLFFKKDEEKIKVYSQPGRWFILKYYAFIVLLSIQRLKNSLKPKFTETQIDKVQSLSNHPKAFDATFFHATSKNGFYICGGVERRHQGKANGVFYLVVPEFGLLEHTKLPNTLMNADPASILLHNEYAAEGISFSMVEPMKTWKLSFNGPMKFSNQPDRIVQVRLESKWTSDFPYFLFENDMSIRALSRAIALEKWNKEFFEFLKRAHQSHYEQMGYLNGTLEVNGRKYNLEMDAFRDHSFGYKRDWKLLHRYIFHMVYLEDGTRVSVGVVSQPCTTSQLEMGYVVLPDKTLHAIEYIDLQLLHHGENGSPGKDYAFCFIANKQTYEARILVRYESTHYKGNNTEAKLIERFLDCEINGINGKGISEWHYNNFNNTKS